MIKKYYILSNSSQMSALYCRQTPNIGYIASTPKDFVKELYDHPVFFLENRAEIRADSYELDLILCEIRKTLSKDNYFYEALEIRGNRRLILKALLELKLSVVEQSYKSLELEDKNKASSLVELYEAYLAQDVFDYADMLKLVLLRIKDGKYDEILKNSEALTMADLELTGLERDLISELEKRSCVNQITSKDGSGLLSSNSKCTSSILSYNSIVAVFDWMDENKLSSANTKIVSLDYDKHASELYKFKDQMPIYLSSGLNCANFCFFENFMTQVSEFNQKYSGDISFILKLQKKIMAQKHNSSLEKCFYTKAFGALESVKVAAKEYEKQEIAIDIYELIASEIENLRFSASELGLESSCLGLYQLEDLYALECENVAVLGLSNSKYPKKKKIDPILKEFERVQINQSTDSKLNLKPFYVEDMLEKLVQNCCGKKLYSYESHDLQTGKLVVASSFFNKILKEKKEAIEIEGVYKLCEVKEAYVDDFSASSSFLKLVTAQGMQKRVNDLSAKLYSADIEDIDFATHDEILGKVSASSLQNFLKCPYMFCLEKLKKIKPVDLDSVDLRNWLDAMDRGTFLHGCYEEILAPFVKKGGDYIKFLKSLADDDLNKAILTVRVSKAFKDLGPMVPDYIKEAEIDEFRTNLADFIKKEIESYDGFYPIGLEWEFDPILEVEIKDQLLKITGYIDRIDTDGKGNFRVIDYKTGKNHCKKDRENLFWVEDKTSVYIYIQHALYSKALNLSKYSNEIQSVDAGYYFCTDAGGWAKVYHQGADQAAKLDEILEFYVDVAKKGDYFKNGAECKYCDYKAICAGRAQARSHKNFKQIESIKNMLEVARD